MLDNLPLLDSYAQQNPDGFDGDVIAQVKEWRHLVHGRFVIERDLKSYTVFLRGDREPTAYGVLGLTKEICDMLPFMPVMVEAVLLPWKERIICDGLFRSYPVIMGGGMKRMYRETYNRAKSRGVTLSLPPGPRSAAKGEPKRPKSPAIARFLKRCPRTVAEFKRAFGEPRMDMANEAAHEYSGWNLDGSLVLDVDYLMLYANIIRGQVLYVYAKNGAIVNIAVVDPTDWRAKDRKPHDGRKLLS